MTVNKQSFIKDSTKHNQYIGTGYRKTSCARVFLRKEDNNVGTSVFVNKRIANDYFSQCKVPSIDFCSVFGHLEITDNFLIKVFVSGGGVSSQISAIRYGIAKALLAYVFTLDETNYTHMKKQLKDLGLITRDSRIVERKKYGFRKARKRKQYSKR